MKPTIIILSVILVACTPQKRLQRLIKRHPHLTTTTYQQISDTTYVRGYSFDTTKVTNKIDSFVLVRDKVRTVVYRNYDTISVFQSRTDTMFIKQLNVPVQEIKVEQRANKWHYVIGSIMFWVVIAAILSFLYYYISHQLRLHFIKKERDYFDRDNK